MRISGYGELDGERLSLTDRHCPASQQPPPRNRDPSATHRRVPGPQKWSLQFFRSIDCHSSAAVPSLEDARARGRTSVPERQSSECRKVKNKVSKPPLHTVNGSPSVLLPHACLCELATPLGSGFPAFCGDQHFSRSCAIRFRSSSQFGVFEINIWYEVQFRRGSPSWFFFDIFLLIFL